MLVAQGDSAPPRYMDPCPGGFEGFSHLQARYVTTYQYAWTVQYGRILKCCACNRICYRPSNTVTVRVVPHAGPSMWISEKLPTSWFVAMFGLKVLLLTSIPVKWLQTYANMLHRIISGKETALVLITTRRSDWMLHQMFTNLEKNATLCIIISASPRASERGCMG